MTDQLRLDGKDQLTIDGRSSTPVECMGMAFESDHARREYFIALLADKLTDPGFRGQPGFPTGDDEDILRMSDPPYYTACPNPFIEDFIRSNGRAYDPEEPYHREPFAVDVSVGKTDALYRAHSYHTKVPHLAIVPSILHYTEPGDIVLDGFCGSGMTGVAAQFCGIASSEYRMEVEAEWVSEGLTPPKWGPRRAILGDLSPAATFIAAGYNIRFDVQAFKREAQRILDEVSDELGWMYETLHTDGTTKGRINYTVWSEVFACSDCGEEVVFVEAALDPVTKRVADAVKCPRCGTTASKEDMTLVFETFLDPVDGETRQRPRRVPVIVNYSIPGFGSMEKAPDAADLAVLERINRMPSPPGLPSSRLPDSQMSRVGRMATTQTTAVHHMYMPRAAWALTALWTRAQGVEDDRQRSALLFFFEQAIWGMSVLNRYKTIMHGKTSSSNVNQYLSGVFYVPSQHSEVSPWYNLENRLGRLTRNAFVGDYWTDSSTITSVGDCSSLLRMSNSVDYVFTDPPFGENIYYADLNFLVESWHRVVTDAQPEAIVDRVRHKSVHRYQDLMTGCFRMYANALKPGRWITVVFSNSSNSVWRAIQEALASSGLVVADVRTLDKQQGSFRQVTTQAVKQDLIISAYKPSEDLEQTVAIASSGPDAAWRFVAEHLANVPNVVGSSSTLESVSERTPQMLHDRMIGFFVQRGLAVPVSTAEFMVGIAQRYPERDGMYFLPEQVAEYDKRRAKVDSVHQLSLMVTDESSAIQWVRQQLQEKPQPFSELQPIFMREAQQSWAKHETQIELKDMLEENFLLYAGTGAVPSQIKSYLSTNWREYRNLEADDPALKAKAKDRWFVPDPGKESDLMKLRERQLLKEFEHYRTSTARKMKLFRTEAVRVGFKRAYEERDWETIVDVAGRLPESVVREDEKLLMYYDVARMRVG